MTKVAVIGAAGLLGQYLVQASVARGHEVLGTYRTTAFGADGVEVRRLDITEAAAPLEVLSIFGPDVVFLASALTNVDHCELHNDEARKVNVEGVRNVAEACHELGCRMVHISTDYVFNGEKAGRYTEADMPDPQNVYARTKLEGEAVVLGSDGDHAVCRVSVLYGWNRTSSRTNFVTWLIGSLRRGEEIRLFGDQRVSPTYAPHCAAVLVDMAERGAKGLYHTSGPDCLDRYTMGRMIAEAFDLDPALCSSIRTEEMPLPAKRCRNSCLAVSKAQIEFNTAMLPFYEGLRDMRSRE